MRILLTGSNGFLGQKLTDLIVGSTPYELLCTSASSNRNPNQQGYTFVRLDFEDQDRLETLILDFRPTHIIHTAAISSVEVCEKQPELCQLVNVNTVGQLATIAKARDIHFTFLSTDFVFDGKEGPYKEETAPNPCNAYGRSKIMAEQILQKSGCRHAILRTILVYGLHADRQRSNLILWVKDKLENNEKISVVSDQWRMPTWVDDLAGACLHAGEKEVEGIYHISGNELMSIFEIAQKVADFWDLDRNLIAPISAKEIGQEHNRPRKTGFILDKAKQELGYTPTPFIESLEQIEQQFTLYR